MSKFLDFFKNLFKKKQKEVSLPTPTEAPVVSEEIYPIPVETEPLVVSTPIVIIKEIDNTVVPEKKKAVKKKATKKKPDNNTNK